MSPLDLQRLAVRIETLQRVNYRGWNPADELEFRNYLPGGRDLWALPQPAKLREMADKQESCTMNQWHHWLNIILSLEGLVRDNDPRNPKRMMRDMARGKFPGQR